MHSTNTIPFSGSLEGGLSCFPEFETICAVLQEQVGNKTLDSEQMQQHKSVAEQRLNKSRVS